jgi:hypothetical protein
MPFSYNKRYVMNPRNWNKTWSKRLLILCGLLLVVPAADGAATADRKATPKRAARRRQGPTIPAVPRDQIICFALYTTQNGVLKLSAQLYPLQPGEARDVTLEIKGPDGWRTVATSQVDTLGYVATFRVEPWDQTRTQSYRVTHPGGAHYEGTIRRDPREKDEIVIAAFTGNSNSDRGPRADIIRNIKAQDPDLLFFSGDQSYDHRQHTAAWLLFGRQFGEIIKDRPTVAIPDDHDVGQGNLWGEGGKVSRLGGGADGGYIMPAAYVNMVQRAQTSHLPDPYDPTPVMQGISVYYTSLNVGGIDCAIIEDRKWKTGPAGLIPPQGPRPDHITSPDYDPHSVDVPEARLLGDRQVEFLHQWGEDWTGVEMKTVLSQTIFGGGAHLHGRINGRLVADLDSNGWPQSGRARALREIRRCFALHIAGDQHLATMIHHGINSWEDANYSFCVPSIVNYYGRWWQPLEAPLHHDSASPLPFTGRYYDGFRNKMTMLAYANPSKDNFRAAGYGLIRLNKKTRKITIECWPRHVDVTQPRAKQYPGWPITIDQQDNYARMPLAWLPRLKITGQASPVVQVIDEQLGEVVYTIRIRGTTWRPKVFKQGLYTIRVGEGDSVQVFQGVSSGKETDVRTLDVQLP